MGKQVKVLTSILYGGDRIIEINRDPEDLIEFCARVERIRKKVIRERIECMVANEETINYLHKETDKLSVTYKELPKHNLECDKLIALVVKESIDLHPFPSNTSQ